MTEAPLLTFLLLYFAGMIASYICIALVNDYVEPGGPTGLIFTSWVGIVICIIIIIMKVYQKYVPSEPTFKNIKRKKVK